MRIIILGANGQLGSRILAHLVQEHPESQVFGCVRHESIATIEHDVAISQALIPFNPFKDNWEQLGDTDVLINCIGIIRETKALDFGQAHVGLTNLIVSNRAKLGNPKIIQVSALGAAVNSPSKFLRTKALADEALLMHPNTVVVRPSIVCTPGTMLSQKLQLLKKLCRFMGGLLPFPERMLQTKLQPVTIEDLTALVSELCFKKDHEQIIEAGGRDVYTLRQLLQFIPTCRKIRPFPQFIFDRLYPVMSALYPALLDKEQQILLQQDNIANTTESERLLGRKMTSTVPFWRAELS